MAFYNGATLIGNGTLSSGTSASGTWSFTWSSVAQGTYSVTARATDNLAATTTSSAVQVTVTAASGGGSGPAAGVYFIEADHLNTPRRITNASQQTVWLWDQQEPFGNSAAQEQPTSGLPVFPFNPRFPGQYLDKETGLAYNYFRDYDPAGGSYRQSDPIGLAGGLNGYAYVFGNPLDATDMYGLESCKGRWLLAGTAQKSFNYPYNPRAKSRDLFGGIGTVITNTAAKCSCYWLCIDCDIPVVWDGDFRKLPQTEGVWVFSATGDQGAGVRGTPNRKGPVTPSGPGVAGGNTCLCNSNAKPGAESGCTTCSPNYPGPYNVQDSSTK